MGRRRTEDSWGAESTAIGRQLGELNTLQVGQRVICALPGTVSKARLGTLD